MMNCSEEKEKLFLPIGFMDSGLGGISVLREAVRILPEEDFIYFGDSENAPYGTKDTKEIKELSFNVVEKLKIIGIKALVVACNTASGAALRDLRISNPDLVIIGIEPAIKPAVICNQGGRIIVLATPMTLKQNKFKKLLDTYKDEAEIVPVPCPGLMEFVENGQFDDEELKVYFDKHLKPYLTENTESIVLGCTHYPFLKKQLRNYLGKEKILLIDGSRGTSSQLKRRLKEEGLLRRDGNKGRVEILNSADRPELIELSRFLLERPQE